MSISGIGSIIVGAAVTCSALGQSFESFTPPSGTNRVVGASADGAVIAGSANGLGWVWDATSGVRHLPSLGGNFTPDAWGISDDGQHIAVVNQRSTSPANQGSRFNVGTWTHEAMGQFAGRSTFSYGISPDGQTLAADINQLVPGGASISPGRWRPGQAIEVLQQNPRNELSFTFGVSNSGAIAGYEVANLSFRAYRSNAAGAVELLPTVQGAASRAYGISRDDRVTIGLIGSRAAAWVDNNPILFEPLPSLPPMVATVMNSNYSIIGGRAGNTGDLNSRAWIWNELSGTILLEAFLAGRGVSVPESLMTLDAITADSRTFIGLTVSGKVYRATIAEPVGGGPIPAPAGVTVAAMGLALAVRRRR